MIVYRICKTYPPNHNPIDGRGSFLKGGRWNPKGVYAVYTSSSLSLARSELARHINLECIPDDFRVYEIEIPDNLFCEPGKLPQNWRSDLDWRETQRIGLDLMTNPENLAIKVPSICDDRSFNFILNPQSIHYDKVKVIADYPFLA